MVHLQHSYLIIVPFSKKYDFIPNLFLFHSLKIVNPVSFLSKRKLSFYSLFRCATTINVILFHSLPNVNPIWGWSSGPKPCSFPWCAGFLRLMVETSSVFIVRVCSGEDDGENKCIIWHADTSLCSSYCLFYGSWIFLVRLLD